MHLGGGLGAFLGHIVTMIPQFLASTAGKKLISAGKDVIQSMTEGSDLKTALKKTGRKTVRDLTGLGRTKQKIPQQRRLSERRRQKTVSGYGQKRINRKPIGIITTRISQSKRKPTTRRHII